jgi:16S rRNA processing protein RimM
VSGSPAELQAGRVGRAHGLDGSFYVTGPLPRLLTLGATVSFGGRSAEIVRRAGTDAHPILRLRGVDDRAGAEALRGVALTVAEAGAPQLREGEWWAHELQGCDVFDGDMLLGTVSRLIELPSCEAIEVDEATGADPLLVPLVRDAIRQVDVAARRIVVDGEFLDLASRKPAASHPAAGGGADPGVEARGEEPAEGSQSGREERDRDGD